MKVLLGPFHILLVVLLLSGADKLLRPTGAAAALRSAQLVPGAAASSVRRSLVMARGLGLAEIGASILALTAASATSALWPSAASALLVGLIFLGFTWFVRRLASKDDAASCGCFGVSTTPPGPAHRWFNLIAVALSIATAVAVVVSGQTPSIATIGDAGASVWIPYLVATVATANLFLLGPSLLAELAAAPESNANDHRSTRTFSVTEALSR